MKWLCIGVCMIGGMLAGWRICRGEPWQAALDMAAAFAFGMGAIGYADNSEPRP